MMLLSTKRRDDTFFFRIQETLVLAACFFILYLKVHPVLALEAMPPVFLLESTFFHGFLLIPGGLSDWLAALFMQFWFSDFVVSVFLTICFWIVAWVTRKWIETLTEHRPIRTMYLIPVCFLLILHSQYYFPLGITVALMINLAFVNVFIRWAPKHKAVRAAAGFVVAVLLYWMTGGAFLVFILLCGANDLFYRTQIANGLLLLIFMPVLPYAASATVFLVPLKEAYFHNLIFEIITNLWINAYILPAFYVITLVFFLTVKIPWIRNLLKKIPEIASVWKYAAGMLFLVGGTIFLGFASYNKTAYLILQTNRDIKEHRWADVIGRAPEWPSVTPLFSFQANTALYHTGMLLNRMFAIPQPLGTLGLLMDFDWCSACAEATSNLYWELGFVSEAQHWTHEAYEQKGYTPSLLKRLGMIYMMKGDQEAAKKYFRNLKNVPFHGADAEYLLRINDNLLERSQNPECSTIQSLMPVNEAVLTGNPSLLQLDVLLQRNPKNKMAFEYMIAYHLLAGNMQDIVNHLPDFKPLGYAELPTHVQEALLIIASQTPNFNEDLLYNSVDRRTYERFLEYRQILLKYQGNKNLALQELQKQFGDTYWFYLMYYKPAVRHPEGQHGYTR
jgi:hypothetical protein